MISDKDIVKPFDHCGVLCDYAEELIKKAKIKAVEKFAESLKEEISKEIYTYWNDSGGGYYLAEDVLPDIDYLVKVWKEKFNVR